MAQRPAIVLELPPRALFAELVAGALAATRVRPTPMATAYLVELLEARLPASAAPTAPDGTPETLAEGLLRARRERGRARVRRLRGLGDRALFTVGFFGDSLERRGPGVGCYGEAGRLAYADLSAAFPDRRAWAELFEELADRFPDFVEVLTEVGDRTRPERLERLLERFLHTEAPRERRRLLRRGYLVPSPCDLPPAS